MVLLCAVLIITGVKFVMLESTSATRTHLERDTARVCNQSSPQFSLLVNYYDSGGGAGGSSITIHSEKSFSHFYRKNSSHLKLKHNNSCLNDYILRFAGIDVFVCKNRRKDQTF